MDAGFNIASVCIHRGEEPAISGPDGICNIFFEGCNLRCIYCQNHEISQPRPSMNITATDPDILLDQIGKILSGGIKAVGFVSPFSCGPAGKGYNQGIEFTWIETGNSIQYKQL